VICDPSNARIHSNTEIALIAASISKFGWTNPILIRPNGRIIGGHARSVAAQNLGLTEVPVIRIDGLTEPQYRALAIADNKLALNAAWDEHRLRFELAELQKQNFDLKLTGFDEEELERLLAEQEEAHIPLDPDAIPAIPEAAVTVPGDLWLLGQHRLLCGDATDVQAMELVLDGGIADMVFTDPPDRLRMIGEDFSEETFHEFLRRAFVNLIAGCKGAIYICIFSPPQPTVTRAFADAGGHFSMFVIWDKHCARKGGFDYQLQYEPILYGWAANGFRYWSRRKNQSDIWSIPVPTADHTPPFIKPVALVERAIENSSRKGATVLDTFAGLGTTLIACHRRDRKARLIEIDPRYVDAICQRWQQYTGNAVILDGNGRRFEQIARERKKAA
jgi:DNA modification methylase